MNPVLIACLVLSVTPLVAAAAPDAAADPLPYLVPSPQEVRVSGPTRSIAPGGLVLTFGAGEGELGWDPAAASLGCRVEWNGATDKPTAGRWSVALSAEGAGAAARRVLAKTDTLRGGHGAEAYRLESGSSEEGVYAIVVGGGPRGLLYGLQTLAQLLRREPGSLPSVSIGDWPAVGGVRELHVHGFDKGYGAGDFKSLDAFTRGLPAILPHVAAGRYNLFRFSIDAGWINSIDRWFPGIDGDRVMREAMARCRAAGVEALVEVRMEGQRAGSDEPDTYPLDPLSEWDVYAKAFRRALSWKPDVIDLSLNDLQALTMPDVVAKYGGDGRFSGVLMAELLAKASKMIAAAGGGVRLHHLPRFYADVYWKRFPSAMPDLWAKAPEGTIMYVTSPMSHPVLVEMRRRYGAQFEYWINYTSNHGKELRVLLDGVEPDLDATFGLLPPEQRHVLFNLGYPVEPQYPVVLATGERLWNPGASRRWESLRKSAASIWGPAVADDFVAYARLLDSETVMASRGVEIAPLLTRRSRVSEDERAFAGSAKGASRDPKTWAGYRARAVEAQEIARRIESEAPAAGVKRVGEILFWNARRIELDSRVGELVTSGLRSGSIDVPGIRALLNEHERLIDTHYPVEPNDPKSAEVVKRGIRRIREALETAGLRSVK